MSDDRERRIAEAEAWLEKHGWYTRSDKADDVIRALLDLLKSDRVKCPHCKGWLNTGQCACRERVALTYWDDEADAYRCNVALSAPPEDSEPETASSLDMIERRCRDIRWGSAGIEAYQEIVAIASQEVGQPPQQSNLESEAEEPE